MNEDFSMTKPSYGVPGEPPDGLLKQGEPSSEPSPETPKKPPAKKSKTSKRAAVTRNYSERQRQHKNHKMSHRLSWIPGKAARGCNQSTWNPPEQGYNPWERKLSTPWQMQQPGRLQEEIEYLSRRDPWAYQRNIRKILIGLTRDSLPIWTPQILLLRDRLFSHLTLFCQLLAYFALCKSPKISVNVVFPSFEGKSS